LLNVGGDEPYKLVIKSSDTGEENAISISSSGTAVSDLGLDLDENHIQRHKIVNLILWELLSIGDFLITYLIDFDSWE